MELGDQIALLQNQLLGAVTTESGDLNESEKALIAAYLVLSHACIEEYVEDAFTAHFDRLSKFFACRVIPREAADLMFAIGLSKQPDLPHSARNFRAAIESGREDFENKVIKVNHGIRPSDIKKIAAAVGVSWKELDDELSTELANINTLASKRGFAGHTSPFSGKAINVADIVYPANAKEWVENASAAAVRLESYLKSLVEDRHGGAHEALIPVLQ